MSAAYSYSFELPVVKRRDVVVVGGMAKNAGFVDSLKKAFEMPVAVPEDPDYIGALGAAEAALSSVLGQED
jgi:activator of 2-hydroxyglutaryl-CoA dehydratase